MALDTSVILAGTHPYAPTNPLALAGEIAASQNALLQARTNFQQLQARQAVGEAYQRSSDPYTGATDYGKLQGIIQSDPRAAWMAPQIAQGIQEQQKRQYDLQEQGLKQNNERSAAFAAGLAPLLRTGNNITAPDVFGVLNRMHAQGYPVQDMINGAAASMPVQPAGQAPDPAYGQKLHDWAVNQFGSSMAPADAARTFLPQVGTISTGGTTQTYDANPQTNPGVTRMAVPNTLTPGEQVAQTKGPLGRGGAPTTQTQARYAQSQGLGALVPGATVPSLFGGATGRLPAALVGPNGAPPQGGAPAGQSQAPAPSYGTPAPMVTGLGPGQQAGLDAAGKASAAQWADLQNSVGGTAAGGGSAGRIYMLQHGQDLLQRLGPTGTGPSSPQTQAFASYIQSLPGIGPIASSLGIDPQRIASYDEANKVLTAYASARAGARGGTTDSQLATTLSSNASTHISNLAAQDVVKANIGLERMDQAQAQAFQNEKDPASGQALTPDQFSNFSADWNNKMDPRAFVADQLSPQQFASTVNGMAPDEQTKFKQTFNTAVNNGWMSRPAWMQQPAAAASLTPPAAQAAPSNAPGAAGGS